MKREELKSKLDAHALWLKAMGTHNLQGERADLMNADLTNADLCGADLCGANLRGADLRCAELTNADLRCADLTNADLRGADLKCADLTSANLRGANLTYADLTYANLKYADLRYVDLTYANLCGADIDYSSWPLCCKSLWPKIDKRIAAQLMYHALRAMQSCADDPDVAAVLASEPCLRLANQFHRVRECRIIEPPKEGGVK